MASMKIKIFLLKTILSPDVQLTENSAIQSLLPIITRGRKWSKTFESETKVRGIFQFLMHIFIQEPIDDNHAKF